MSQKKDTNFFQTLLKWGLVAVAAWLVYSFFQNKKQKKDPQTELIQFQEKLISDLKSVRNKFMGAKSNNGSVYVPKNYKPISNKEPELSDGCAQLVDQNAPLGSHVSELKSVGKRKLAPMPRNSRRFQLRNIKKKLSTGFKEYAARASKLLPPQGQTAPENSDLSDVEKKWVKRANLPSLDQIKEAQSIRASTYFNQVPLKKDRISDATHCLRAPLKTPPPPKMIFNQPL